MNGPRRRLLISLTTLACVAPVPHAVAQEEGVFIDPRSPTAKEYALPIESARRQADPVGSQATRIARGTATAPLFGNGIVSGAQAQAESSAASGRPGGSASSPSGSANASSGADAPGTAAIPLSRPGTPEGGLSLLFVGAAVLVLIAGALAGLLLRRREEP